MKISFHSDAKKTNFHLKNLALSLAFIVRFTPTRKWPILISQRETMEKLLSFTQPTTPDPGSSFDQFNIRWSYNVWRERKGGA